jgi:trans-aconitate methyltransferase
LDLSEIRHADGERHPWEIARVRALTAIVRRHQTRVCSILDVGCGDGFLGESLQAALNAQLLVGVDVNLPEIACGVHPTPTRVVERYRSDTAVGDRRFDLILALDVIEHVADDRALLADVVARRTRPGSLVLVTVPAFQSLFSDHDHALRHFRRYRVAQLGRVLRSAGLQILEDGYLFASLLAPRAVAVLRERIGRHRPDHGIGSWHGPPWLTQLAAATLTLDAQALLAARHLGIRLPGLTAWALCAVR